jgi:hypothetical protein
MKLTQKHLKMLSGLFLLLGAVIVILTKNYNENNPEDLNNYGKWLGIFIMIIGLVFLAPWIKDKNNHSSELN